jgi:hypothetical protein
MGGETEVLGEQATPMPLCPPQLPHDLTRARTMPPRWEAGD